MDYTNLKSVTRHVANLKQKGFGFPFSLTTLVKIILEVERYQNRTFVRDLIGNAFDMVMQNDRPVTAIVTRFKLFGAFRMDALLHDVNPTISVEELKTTHRVGSVWGVDWYTDLNVAEDIMYIISDVGKDRQVYTFQLQDDVDVSVKLLSTCDQLPSFVTTSVPFEIE